MAIRGSAPHLSRIVDHHHVDHVGDVRLVEFGEKNRILPLPLGFHITIEEDSVVLPFRGPHIQLVCLERAVQVIEARYPREGRFLRLRYLRSLRLLGRCLLFGCPIFPLFLRCRGRLRFLFRIRCRGLLHRLFGRLGRGVAEAQAAWPAPAVSAAPPPWRPEPSAAPHLSCHKKGAAG